MTNDDLGQAAIRHCRAAIAEQAGIPADRNVRFERIRTSGSEIWTRFRVRGASQQTWRAECTVDRRDFQVVRVEHGAGAPVEIVRAAPAH